MTIAQSERFYKQDNKVYELNNNENFIKWFQQQVNNGYEPFITIDVLQHLINTIANWYEIKYPNRYFNEYEDGFKDIIDISNYMDFDQLLYRLSKKKLCLIRCEYMAKGGGVRAIYNSHAKVIAYEPEIFVSVKRKSKVNNDFSDYYKLENQASFLLYANAKTGKVRIDHNVESFISSFNNVVTLENLLNIFEKTQKDNLDYTELKQCVNNHKIDLELRKIILQIVALKLLYSENTIPEYGYMRAKKFILEFNKHIPKLNLSFEEIDFIIKREYNNTSDENKNSQNKIKNKIFNKK